MNKRTFLTALGSALVAVTAGCAEKTGEEAMSELENVTELGKSVTRFIDREAGVVIYRYHGFEKGGLAVIPITETHL